MDVDAILTELQTLSGAEPSERVLPRLREMATAADRAGAPDKYSKAELAAALTHQAIDYIIEGMEREQNWPEIKRRFAIAIKRAEAWAREQSPAFRPADEA